MDADTNALDKLVQQMLAPLPGASPAGRWVRYEPVFMETARLREEDDPTLPMGEWERPLVKADWRKVAEACERLLAEHTKDFQIAGWLLDAWIRTARMDGLCAGLMLVHGLAQQYWESAWPAIEDGDTDRRVAPFVWMNTNLPLTLRLNVVLLSSALHRQEAVTLLDWERAPTADDAQSSDGEPRTRREIRDSVRPADAESLYGLVQRADAARAELDMLSRWLDERLQHESPSLSKLSATVDAIKLATTSLLQELPAPAPAKDSGMPASAAASSDAKAGASSEASTAALSGAAAAAIPTAAAHTPSSVGAEVTTEINDRAQAYAALTALADYLQITEPHSPTPYLIRRAVQLGQMSLPEMVREVSASAGSLDKFFELLGIAPPT